MQLTVSGGLPSIMLASIVVAMPAMLPMLALAQSPGPASLQARIDRDFLAFAADDNQAEIRESLNAQNSAQSPAVMAFSRLVVVDYQALKAPLDSLLSANQIKLSPAAAQQAPVRVQPGINANFDSAFIATQVEHGQNDVLRFQDEQTRTQNEGISRFTAAALPILQQELELARAVQAWLASHVPQTTGSTTR